MGWFATGYPAFGFFFLLLFSCFDATPAQAANKYVRAGATGAANGSDWTNAYTTLPATLTRGDTYYIADGTYPGRSFTTAVSGTTLITIKKATVADHGTETGWNSTFGDGQAVFTSTLQFNTSHWVLDGQTGGGPGSWTTGFGFKIAVTTPTSAAGIRTASNVTNITVRHFEIQGNGGDGSNPAENDGISTFPGTSNHTFSYGYIHDMGRTIVISHATNTVFEYIYTGLFESTASQHAEIAALYTVTNVTFRYNIFTFAIPTGGLMATTCPVLGCPPVGSGGFYVYGNVFYKAPGSPPWGGGNGLIGTWSAYQLTNAKVYNNSFVNVVDMPVFGNLFTPPATGNEVRNNLFYNVTNDGLPGGLWPTVTHNHWVDSGAGAGSNATTGTGNPFVDYLSLDFRLTGATATGMTLASPYAEDMLANTRGSGGTWNRGAIEFGGTPTANPTAPTNLVVR